MPTDAPTGFTQEAVPRRTRWKKCGKRYFQRDHSDVFNAVIFGAPCALWAWAVWSHKRRAEGVEFSLASARKKANEKIAEAEFMQGMEP